jgi:hypothetical protein
MPQMLRLRYCSSVYCYILEIEFDCWKALEHANAANAETQVYVVL